MVQFECVVQTRVPKEHVSSITIPVPSLDGGLVASVLCAKRA